MATAIPFAFLALPEELSNNILGIWAGLAFSLAGVFFMFTGIISLGHWWRDRSERVRAVETTLAEMGYANTRNVRQQMGGKHGRP